MPLCRFGGYGNGKLLTAAEGAGFDVLVTVDQNLPRQENTLKRVISIVVLKGRTTDIDDLMPLLPALFDALRTLLQVKS